MIPVRLAMRNFMCYRDNVPALSFAGIHLACLSGDNGSGKSALIDAMTWALWGQTRAKSDDELVYSNQAEMQVEFDFAIGQQLYRIIRRHSRPKRLGRSGQTVLEFQIWGGDRFRPISGEGVTQTQRKIIDVLHMDYDTFTNSAYLRQGHADEFTRQPATRRKEVLANILGFSVYDALEEQARELAKQQESEKAQLDSVLRGISDELEQKPVCEVEMAQAQGELTRIEAVVKEKEVALKAQRQMKESLEAKQAQLEQLRAHMKDDQAQLALWNEQASQHRARLVEYEALIAQRVAIEEGYARLSEARQQNDELERRSRLTVALERQRAHLEGRIKDATQGLLTEHAVIQSRVGELEVRLQRLPQLKSELQQTVTETESLAEHEAALRQKQQAGLELQAGVARLEADGHHLEQAIRETVGKLALLSRQAEARCPLCETELGAEGLRLIESKYRAEASRLAESLKSNQTELARSKTESEKSKKETSEIESRLNREKSAVQGRAGILKKEITEAEAAEKQLTAHRERLGAVELQMARKDFAAVELGVLAQVEGELARLGYDADQHDTVRHRVAELAHYDDSKRKLGEADGSVGQVKEAVLRAEEAAARLRRSLDSDNQTSQALETELALLPRVRQDMAQAETEFQALTSRRNQAQESVWSVKAKLERCEDLERKKREKEALLAEAAKQEDIYKELSEAFGKRGIQALLIEMVLPEIEAEANRLLGRMTDNRMHVKFETQRETKKGDVVETLDINIADELGTRNYEMFSGGEAFRINFAIRIALSRLLARRAGAPLPTLIIDEGFGTQDATGIEKLKEAINSIQDDFEKIIVVTHIEELRDAFPTRIDVVKTAEGSTLSVS